MDIFDEDRKFTEKRDFITLDSVDSLVLDDAPDFLDYLFYHNVLDKFCWLMKFQYSDRETVKRKKYRIDTTFQRFAKRNFRADRAQKALSQAMDESKLEYHLTKGWLNEAVRSVPLHPDYLEAGTLLSKWDGPGSEGLASWNVIQSYYAFYEYICTLTASIDPSVDTRGHRSVAREFSNRLIGTASNRLVFYPFNLTSRTPKRYIPTHPPYLQFHYASYPREPGRHIDDLEIEIQQAFKLLGGKGKRSVCDFFYDLRLWANYTGVQSLMKLTDGGYQKFLMRNIAILVFFVGGMAEFAAISALGESKFLGILKRFSLDYIDKHERFARNKFLVPFYIRLRSYKHLGLIDGSIDFIIPESIDPVRFIEI